MNKSVARFGSILYDENVNEGKGWRVEVIYFNGFGNLVSLEDAKKLDIIRLAYYACELELPAGFDVWKWAVEDVLNLPTEIGNEYIKSYVEMKKWTGRQVYQVNSNPCLMCDGSGINKMEMVQDGKRRVHKYVCSCDVVKDVVGAKEMEERMKNDKSMKSKPNSTMVIPRKRDRPGTTQDGDNNKKTHGMNKKTIGKPKGENHNPLATCDKEGNDGKDNVIGTVLV